MTREIFTPTGQKVAFEELATFFNNNTIIYGMSFYKPGMSKKEWQAALEANWFEEAVAKAFIEKYWWERDFVDGRGVE